MANDGFFWVFIWFFAVIGFWTNAFLKLHKQTGGTVLFFKHLIAVVVLLSISTFLINASAANCTGILCGIVELLVSLAIVAAVLIIWPMVMAFVIAKKRMPLHSSNSEFEDILDN